MYRRAYGGITGVGAFEEPTRAATAPATTPAVHKGEKRENEDRTEWPVKMTVAMKPITAADIPKIGKPPSPKAHTPVLKLQTTFETPVAVHKPTVIRPAAAKPAPKEEILELEIKIDAFSDNEDEDGDITARPTASGGHGMSFWNGIDEVLARRDQSEAAAVSPVIQRLRASHQRLGPVTPNGYEDISPVTRGEWGFLFKGDGWNGGRTAAVETF